MQEILAFEENWKKKKSSAAELDRFSPCPEKTGELDFSTFLTMMHRQIQQEQPRTEILAALRMFDKQKRGFIPASELRTKLTKMGEKLTNKEGNTSAGTDQQAVKC